MPASNHPPVQHFPRKQNKARVKDSTQPTHPSPPFSPPYMWPDNTKERKASHTMSTRSRARDAHFHGVEGAGESLLESVPLDLIAYIVAFAGSYSRCALGSSSRQLHQLCKRDEVVYTARKAEMEAFRRGMDHWFGTNGVVRDQSENCWGRQGYPNENETDTADALKQRLAQRWSVGQPQQVYNQLVLWSFGSKASILRRQASGMPSSTAGFAKE